MYVENKSMRPYCEHAISKKAEIIPCLAVGPRALWHTDAFWIWNEGRWGNLTSLLSFFVRAHDLLLNVHLRTVFSQLNKEVQWRQRADFEYAF